MWRSWARLVLPLRLNECWCTPPTEGQVSEVFWGANGQLFVVAETAMKPGGRDQPTYGWGCTGLFG
jgi:hypothetical protein